MNTKNFVFAVQGEGRGHLTQAISLYEILKKNGHTVSCVIVGRSSNREIPDFFTKKFSVPVIPLESPNFTTDKNSKAIRLGRTIIDNTKRAPAYRKSVRRLDEIFRDYRPDIVINFFEPLVGWYGLTRKPVFTIISIAHQYIYLHPQFRFPGGMNLQALSLKWYTWFTAIGSKKLIALSMYNLPGKCDPKLVVAPPLLREELFRQQTITEDFILVYLLNSGYIYDIFNYHKKDPALKLVCFTDSPEVSRKHKGKWEVDDTLVFHSLNDQKFLSLMASCKGLVCTAGFESVCEAMYLDKPVMMVPVKGHYEQYCNALDSSRIGAGIYAEEFDLARISDCVDQYKKEKNVAYREWVDSFERRAFQEIMLADPQINQPKKLHMKGSLSYILAILSGVKKLIP